MKTFTFKAEMTPNFKPVTFIKLLRTMCGHGLKEAKDFMDSIRYNESGKCEMEVPVYGNLGYTNSCFENLCLHEAGLIVICDDVNVAIQELITHFLRHKKYDLAIDAIKLLEKMDNQL